MANFDIHTGHTNTPCMPDAQLPMLCGTLKG